MRIKKIALIAIMVLSAATAFLCAAANAEDPQPTAIVIVVAKACPVDGLTMKELQDIFLRRRSRIGGTELEPLNMEADDKLRMSFDRAVLGMSPDESKKYWISMRIKGEGGPPKTQSSALAIKRLVAKMDGKKVSSLGIGYIRLEDVDDTVKALAIDGMKPPAAAGDKTKYPLVVK